MAMSYNAFPQYTQDAIVTDLGSQYVGANYGQYGAQVVGQYPQVVGQYPQVVGLQQEVVQVPVQRQVNVIQQPTRIVERVVPQYVDRVVQAPPQIVEVEKLIQSPPQVVERVVQSPPQVVHTRDPTMRIRLELCKHCLRNPVNQRALQDLRYMQMQPHAPLTPVGAPVVQPSAYIPSAAPYAASPYPSHFIGAPQSQFIGAPQYAASGFAY